MLKCRPDDLAIFGGPPHFAEPLHVGRPNVGNRERFFERLNDLLDRRWLSNNGKYVQEFEARIAERLGVKHCVAVCNGHVGLEIAARALDLSGEVIVPSMTFVSTAHALKWLGLDPVFCDVDDETYTLDPRRVEEAIGPRTSAILGVHLWGAPCAVEELASIARRRGLRLFFDAAHAFDCSHQGRMIGGFGDAEVFSFHATKFFNSFEGGAITTNDDEVARRARLMRNFGFSDYDTVVSVGTNGKMSEAAAAMGLTNLEDIDEFTTANYENYLAYRAAIKNIDGLTLVSGVALGRQNYQYVVVDVDPMVTGLSRDDLVELLWAENVRARRYFVPGCHRVEPYRSLGAAAPLPVTERVLDRVLTLPTGTALGPAAIADICDLMRFAVDHGEDVARRLAARRAGCGPDTTRK
ncbi:MAG TPA: aminotransferase class I/II-fold pyridoxal phosphate-dependent enzyme [Candidatus Acidoferrum sp.]|nr:aminotransferase class I/II-fold pyridoxal phosphate-dependent enzyme [Candidatus Acidoferrum sp.]